LELAQIRPDRYFSIMKHVPREIYREEELQMCGRITGTFEFSDIRVRSNLDRAIYRCTRPALTSPTLSNT